jgi:hypothetical protein
MSLLADPARLDRPGELLERRVGGKIGKLVFALACRAGLAGDGRVELDSNTVERAIRPLTPNRKNALFAGSGGGAEHWAVVASLIETCKLIDVEPHNYLADVISHIVSGHPQSRRDDPPLGLFHPANSQGRGLRTSLSVDPASRG